MSESIQGILIFLVLAITCSLISHYWIKRISIAILCSIFATVILFQLIVYFLNGYLDPFYIVAILTTSAITFFIALIIAIPFRLWRKGNVDTNDSAT